MDDVIEVAINDSAHCFVPELLVDHLNKNIQRGKGNIEPDSFFLHGVCLLVDISGFTKLSGDFCDHGKSGIDELQLATNGYMGKLVDIIYHYGGDIIKFAGDAIICVFSTSFITTIVNPSKDNKGGKRRRRSTCGSFDEHHNWDIGSGIAQPVTNVTAPVVLRAMLCAAELRDVKTDKLSVHVAMSAGEMCFGVLGGYENRWECLISGPCIHVLSNCLDDAPSQHAVMCPACFEVLQKHFESAFVGIVDSSLLAGIVTLDKAPYKVEIQPLRSGNFEILTVLCANDSDALNYAILKSLAASAQSQADSLSRLIRPFVPAPIAEELESSSTLNYLAEIREVTTMFMKVCWHILI
jgi:class 3 adenylate cyclase